VRQLDRLLLSGLNIGTKPGRKTNSTGIYLTNVAGKFLGIQELDQKEKKETFLAFCIV
jgi:uracil-DNA glycosylase